MTKEKILFKSQHSLITASDIRNSLEQVEAYDCEILYIHTGLDFGIPNREIPRSQFLSEIFDVILSLNINTLIMPTFTFSFCNQENFNVQKSRSSMGAINEHFRLLPSTIRSRDPLLSVCASGKDLDLVSNLGNESIGSHSNFDQLSKRENVKFLFFGTNLEDCFTYMHYLEWVAKVPYRYNKKFQGLIMENNKEELVSYDLFVRYNNIFPNADTTKTYKNLLTKENFLKIKHLGNSSISVVDESSARALYLDLLAQDPNFFIQGEFCESEADKTFIANKMVSL
jgi:aminoglycoside 3-N-acetyltransferase